MPKIRTMGANVPAYCCSVLGAEPAWRRKPGYNVIDYFNGKLFWGHPRAACRPPYNYIAVAFTGSRQEQAAVEPHSTARRITYNQPPPRDQRLQAYDPGLRDREGK